MTSAAAQASKRFLVHPVVDFMTAGGLSLIFLFVCWGLGKFYGIYFYKAAMWAFYASFFVNFPHFSYSYQVFYSTFWARLKGEETAWHGRLRMVIAGVIVPVTMLAYFIWTFRTERVDLLSYGVVAMQFTVGWHYVKQGYGVLITDAVYKGIHYTTAQKRLLYGNAYLIWLFSIVNIGWLYDVIYKAKSHTALQYYDLFYTLPTFSPELHVVTTLAMFAGFFIALGVILKAGIADKKGFPWTGIVGYFSAAYLWVVFPYLNPAFFFFVPFFHSLQYLPFIYKFKKSELTDDRAKEKAHPRARDFFIGFFLIGFLLGGFFLDWGPKWLDKNHAPWIFGFSKNAYLIAFLLFVNIHHYFIDSAFWRRDNQMAQKYLFKA